MKIQVKLAVSIILTTSMLIGCGEKYRHDPIWQDDPKAEGFKVSISPIIQAALDLCQWD